MSAVIIDGKKYAQDLSERTAAAAAKFTKSTGIVPALAVVLAGSDPASQIYVRNKVRACGRAGIRSYSYTLPGDVTQDNLIELIDALNADTKVHGILVQLPLPRHIDEEFVLSRIDVQKDVDGFSTVNTGKLMRGDMSALLPCTPAGCIELIKSTGKPITGQNAVVVGRSNIVGKPLAMLLLSENATVTVCHSRTRKLSEYTRGADILCVAAGIARFIKGGDIKPGATVIDVGINRTPEGLCGDVDFDSACAVAGFITPVPGGVGPMTIAMLMENTLKAAKMQCNS